MLFGYEKLTLHGRCGGEHSDPKIARLRMIDGRFGGNPLPTRRKSHMQDKPARLAVRGPHAFANVIIGQAQFGKFRLMLWDETGRNPQVLTEQTNVDNIPDLVDLGTREL